MKNSLRLALLSLPLSLTAPASASFDALVEQAVQQAGGARQSAAAANQRPAAAATNSPYTAECWYNRAGFEPNRFDYPVCSAVGYKAKQKSNRYATPDWLDSIFLHSVDLASFEGTPLQAEALSAVAGGAVDTQNTDAYAAGLFDLLRLATAPSADPKIAKRRVNAAVKSRWILVVDYARLCEKHLSVCAPKYLADFYAIAKQDYSPRTRQTAMSLVYAVDTDRARVKAALDEMAARDGESLLSVSKDGAASYSSQPSAETRAFAAYLRDSAPAKGGLSWGCFAEALRWNGRSQIGLYYSACR